MNTARKTTEYTATIYVYLAPLPDSEPTSPVYPPLRQQQIDECKNERVRKEKYHVWKLLEYAFRDRYGKPLEDLHFSCANGKWDCDLCYFSLSHSHGALCVSISDSPIGVDLEKIIEPSTSLAKKILSADELQRYSGMPKSEKSEFFTRIWTSKESRFKQVGGAGFFTAETGGHSQETTVSIGGKEYVLSIASNASSDIQVQHIAI